MKRIIVRAALFLFGGIGIFFSPWITLIAGGLFFSLMFRFPLEVLAWGSVFEILSGAPSGVVLIPLGVTMALQNMFAEQFDIDSLFTKGFLFLASVAAFVLLRSLFFLLMFEHSQSDIFRFFVLL